MNHDRIEWKARNDFIIVDVAAELYNKWILSNTKSCLFVTMVDVLYFVCHSPIDVSEKNDENLICQHQNSLSESHTEENMVGSH